LVLQRAPPELVELIAFMGLSDVLRVEPRRQPEEREQRLRLEEEGELDDLAVLDLEHLERPRVVAAARLARLVLAERGGAVGGPRRDHLRALAADTRAVPPRQDVVAAAQPHV